MFITRNYNKTKDTCKTWMPPRGTFARNVENMIQEEVKCDEMKKSYVDAGVIQLLRGNKCKDFYQVTLNFNLLTPSCRQ